MTSTSMSKKSSGALPLRTTSTNRNQNLQVKVRVLDDRPLRHFIFGQISLQEHHRKSMMTIITNGIENLQQVQC
jgi:hypothetical protein